MREAKVNRSELVEKEIKVMANVGNKQVRSRAWSARGQMLAAVAALVALAWLMSAGVAQAAAPALTLRTEAPDRATAGIGAKLVVYMENSGTETMSEDLMLEVTMADGLSVAKSTGQEFVFGGIDLQGTTDEGSCEESGQVITCAIKGAAMRPSAQEWVTIPLRVAPDASGELVSSVKGFGGGVAEPVQRQETITVGPPPPFDVEFFDAVFHDANSTADVQAGAAPGTASNVFTIPTFATMPYSPMEGFSPGATFTQPNRWQNAVAGHPRNILVHTPPGLVANFNATPNRCTAVQLNSQAAKGQLAACPPESQIGVAHVIGALVVPVYNMVPPPGVAAEFGFSASGVAVLIDASVRPTDFGVDLVSSNTSATILLREIEISLWGVPADPSHDSSRDVCLDGENGNSISIEPTGICPSAAPRKAFLRLPTSCTGPLPWEIEMDTYEEPGVYRTKAVSTPAQVGCNQLEFTPTLEAKPTTNLADSPSGLDLKLHLPQNEDPEGLAEAHLRNATVRLPEGLVLNSAAADGLGACAPNQIGLLTPVGQMPARFDGSRPSCPAASKLGSVSVDTPTIDHTLPGAMYLATQGENPFGSLVALYLVIDDPTTGVVVKVPMRADLDPRTGRLTTSVVDNPQLPFEDLRILLDEGAHAPLRTPISCGGFTTTADMTPWSTPEGQDAHTSGSFEIVKGAGGGTCAGSAAEAPFDPKFTAGTLEPRAAAFSPFAVEVSRPDGSQEMQAIDVDLPEGLLASLVGIPQCSERAVASVPTSLGTGKQEIAQPSCPAASQIGSVTVALGAGPTPLHLTTGKAYWAGPYKGAPESMAVIFPAVAGPFDLGNIVVRTPFYIDPETTQTRAKSDPLPNMIHGIPIDLRSVRIDLDRPDFTLNPTSCDPMSVEGKVHSVLGKTAAHSERFQVGGCAQLAFKPKLSLRLKGGTTRSKNPALRAIVTYPRLKSSNIARASVALPHSQFLDQAHIGTVCTRVQFAADQCPAKSVYGYASASSPLIEKPLRGPVYLRSSNNPLPDLVAALDGEIDLDIVGRIDTKDGGIRTTFDSVPDAPVSKFTLRMMGGKRGLLENSTNICRGTHRATAVFDAHNGKRVVSRPELNVSCPKSKKKKKRAGRREQ